MASARRHRKHRAPPCRVFFSVLKMEEQGGGVVAERPAVAVAGAALDLAAVVAGPRIPPPELKHQDLPPPPRHRRYRVVLMRREHKGISLGEEVRFHPRRRGAAAAAASNNRVVGVVLGLWRRGRGGLEFSREECAALEVVGEHHVHRHHGAAVEVARVPERPSGPHVVQLRAPHLQTVVAACAVRWGEEGVDGGAVPEPRRLVGEEERPIHARRQLAQPRVERWLAFLEQPPRIQVSSAPALSNQRRAAVSVLVRLAQRQHGRNVVVREEGGQANHRAGLCDRPGGDAL